MSSAEKPTKSLPAPSDKFFLECEEMELSKIAQEIGSFFNCNVLVSPESKTLKVTANLTNLDLKGSLDLVSWLAGIEWYEKEGTYFLGGNKDYIEVLDNTGIDKSITTVFSNNSVKILEDKIVICGTEREVKRISGAIKKLQEKNIALIRIWGYEVTEDEFLRLGIDIDKSIKYAASWENIITNGYNPIQSLAVSLAMSVEANKTSDDLKLLLDTHLTCISGKSQSLTVGEAVDRVISSTNEQGKVFTSSYQTLQTGYILQVSAYKYDGDDFIFDVNVENSVAQTELRRNRLLLKNTIVLPAEKTALVGRLIKDTETVSIVKGVPLLCDIPYIGYLFRVTAERKVRRHVVFFIERLKEARSDAGATAPPEASATKGVKLIPLLKPPFSAP